MTARMVSQPSARKPVEGITPLMGPRGANAGIFQLPPSFDRRLHSAQWAEVGVEAEFLQQPQILHGLNLQAVGWQIWKDPATGNERKVTTRGAKGQGSQYVLMFRPRTVQEEVNALYGDKSKASIYKTRTGEMTPAVEGIKPVTSGMLGEEELRKMDGELEDPIIAPEPSAKSPGGPIKPNLTTKEKS